MPRPVRRRPVPRSRPDLLALFLVGSGVTLLLAGWLVARRHPLAALGVLEVSPFPCPPGIPC